MKKNPSIEKASERIEWFARAIVSLESTTEGQASTYAANDLLLVSFRWSPKSAVSLFRWFIDQRVIVHEEAFCILLKEALEADNSVAQIALYSLFDFILPIAINAYPDISELIIEKAALEGDCNSIKNAKYMLDKLKIYALPSTRSTWYNGISHAIKENGLNLSCQEIDGHPHQPDKEQEASSSKLKLNDGSCLRLEEVGKQVTSIKILINLLNKEQAESYFNWSPVIERLVEDMDLEEMRELAGLYEGKQYSANVYSIISKRLLDLNYSDDAWDIGLKSLGASRPGGWDRQYDGGSRLFAFKALIQTDPKKGRSILWNTLERDLDDASWLSQRLLFNLEELLSLMSDDPPFKETWNEIEHYVHMLFEPRQLPEYNLRHSQQRISMHPSSRAIADLLAVHLNHPVNIVSQSSRRACAKLLMRDDLEIQNALRELLMEDESYQEAILMVLDAISIQFPDSIKIFSKEIKNLYQSSNYAIRRISQTLGARIGLDAANTEDNKKPKLELVYLPLIYQLYIPRVLNSSRKLEISDNKPLPDSNDPFEIISPFEFQIELIAREAALSEINVCYRAIEIMRELGSSYSWSEEDERDLRVTLESARLCFTFHRPRPQLVRRAIYHIVSELSDVGLLDTKNLCNLNPFLRFYDTFMVLAEPISRPNYILPLAGIDKYGDKSEIWAKKVSEAIDSCAFRAADDLLILAEKTTLKRLAWENPSEIRRSIVCLTEASDVSSYEEHQTFFHHEINVAVSDYFDLLPQLDPNPLIILNESRGYDSPGENWLALNPMIARQVGWNLSKDGLFRWINDKGEVMVESIWWSDGFIGQHPPHFDDEVGEGWLVIASQNALYALKSESNNLRRMVNVIRNFYKNGRQVKFDAQHEFSI